MDKSKSSAPRASHHDELHREYLEQLREMERQRGRRLLPSELDSFTRAFYAPYYREDLRRIPQAAWDELDRELEDEDL